MLQNPISTSFQRILNCYLNTIQSEPNTKSSEVYSLFFELGQHLQSSNILAKDDELLIDWSCGKGRWAFIPWVAVFHNQETHTTQRGVYVIYLFRQDMQGFYLTLNQGVTNGMDYKVTGEERFHKLHKTALLIREQSKELIKSGFKLDNSIDLKATSVLGKNYVQSTIAHKYYDLNNIPDDKTLLKDLDAVLKAYLAYVKTK
jgi:5-methylcytosine-specific restriction protein B